MSKQTIIPIIYGYIVCLIAVMTFLFSVDPLVKAILDIKNIEYSSSYCPSSRNYETFKTKMVGNGSTNKINEESIKRMYDENKYMEYKRAYTIYQNKIINSTVLVLLSIVLFLWHWFLVRGIANKP